MTRSGGRWTGRAGRSIRAVGGRAGHAAIRRLLAERMDTDLSPEATAELTQHLLGCARCRSVARAYEESRRLLRELRPSVPPRDLGARISAALDREVAGGTLSRGLRRADPRLTGSVVVGGTAVVLLVIGARLLTAPTATTTLEFRPEVRPEVRPETRRGVAPTPFAVPVGELALVELGSGGLTVYQAAVDRVCPAAAADCATADYETRPVVGIATDLVPKGVALDRVNRRLALLAEDAMGSDTLSVVVLPPMGDTADPQGAGPGPDGRWPSQPGGPPLITNHAPYPSMGPAEAPARMLAILEGVDVVGASPAWSPDGSILAFSAMPTDRSRGPDVYTWSPGQDRARRLTSDHGSWFASWSGPRIVLSRLARGDGRDDAATVLIEPEEGAEEQARLTGAWLPAVDPSGRFAVAWRGTITGTGAQVRPRTGGLGLIDWQVVDPAAAATVALVTGTPQVEPAAASGPAALAAPPDGVTQAVRSLRARGAGVFRARTGPRRLDGTAGAAVNRAAAAKPWLESIESGTKGAPAALDWQVRWATSGTTFGYWVADARGASWGRLTVLRVLAEARRIDRGTVILGPTLARRSFTLGEQRIAWVAPADEGADGELRVRTWGDPGEGSIRIRDIRIRDGIPAF